MECGRQSGEQRPGLLDIVGKVYGVTFREAHVTLAQELYSFGPCQATGSGFFSRLAGGWRTSLKIFEAWRNKSARSCHLSSTVSSGRRWGTASCWSRGLSPHGRLRCSFT